MELINDQFYLYKVVNIVFCSFIYCKAINSLHCRAATTALLVQRSAVRAQHRQAILARCLAADPTTTSSSRWKAGTSFCQVYFNRASRGLLWGHWCEILLQFYGLLWACIARRVSLTLYSTTQPRTTVICLSVCLAENGSPSYGSSANVFCCLFWERFCYLFRVLCAVRWFYGHY